MKKILLHLYEYCQINSLVVNLEKTKILLFQKGGHGHKKRDSAFLFGNQIVAYAKEYMYLGVHLTQTALYESATNQFLSKAKAASASTISLIYSLKVSSFKVFKKLFEALVRSMILYAAPIYAVRHLTEIEKIQTVFFKRLLHLPQCVPNYAVRLELGLIPIAVSIFKQVLNWIIKVLNMHDDRYPKICFLKQLTLISKAHPKYNWISQIKSTFLDPINEGAMMQNISAGSLINKKQELLETYSKYLLTIDMEKRNSSTSLMIYPELNLTIGNQTYLELSQSFNKSRLFAQVRLMSVIYPRIIIDSKMYVINNNTLCDFCCKQNDLFHMLIECPRFSIERKNSTLPLRDDDNLDLFEILENPRIEWMNKFKKYLSAVCTPLLCLS